MTDTRLAFAHPEERAAATAGSLDRISLRDHVVEVEIGAFHVERGMTQRVRFDVVIEVSPPDAPLGDDVDRILSYDLIAEAIAAELASGRHNLLETLAEGIAARLLAEPAAERIFLRIQKLDRGPGDLGVEIERRRSDVAPTARTVPRPVIVLVPDERDATGVDRWISGLALDRAIVIVPPVPQGIPAANGAQATRHIALLGMAQMAWVIAAQWPQASVVESRTEMEWALARGIPVIWAPAKMALDATPPLDDIGPGALAHWLGGELAAREMVIVGEAPASTQASPGTGLPMRWLAP